MSAGHVSAPAAASDFGITPAVQGLLNRAALAIREAIVAVEAALEAAEEDSDAECRCGEALQEL